jgi:tetratricopeptide (TPR) repeat protein
VDNWAHVGGLVTGAATALGLEPRLLAEGKPSRRRRLLLVAPLVLGVGLAALGAWVAVRGPRMQTVADDGMGLRLEVPRSWVKGTERFGQLAFHNGLVGVGRASFSVQTQPRGDRTLDEVVQAYVQRTLVPEERAGSLRDIVVHPARVERLAGREGRLLEATYSEEGGGTRMQAHFLQRGEQVYELVYAWSERYPRYEAVIGASTASVALVEPGVLRELRAQALLAPSTATLTQLGSMLAVVGEQEGAVAAFSWAVEQQPEEGEAHVKLAGALLGAGRVEEACRAAEAGVGFLPEDPGALSTMSDCKRAQGDKLGALRYLRRAIEAAPRDEALKAKLEALQ